jgi:hypothetical protein
MSAIIGTTGIVALLTNVANFIPCSMGVMAFHLNQAFCFENVCHNEMEGITNKCYIITYANFRIFNTCYSFFIM